jgi:hypothetical protein
MVLPLYVRDQQVPHLAVLVPVSESSDREKLLVLFGPYVRRVPARDRRRTADVGIVGSLADFSPAVLCFQAVGAVGAGAAVERERGVAELGVIGDWTERKVSGCRAKWMMNAPCTVALAIEPKAARAVKILVIVPTILILGRRLGQKERACCVSKREECLRKMAERSVP